MRALTDGSPVNVPPTFVILANIFFAVMACTLTVIAVWLLRDPSPFHSSSLQQIFVYKVMPLSLAAAMAGAFALRTIARVRLALVVMSVIFCCYVTEFLLVLFWKGDPILNMLRQQNERHETLEGMWGHIEELTKVEGRPIFPAFWPRDPFRFQGKEIHPLSRISRVGVVIGPDGEGRGWSYYDSDEYGFHNPLGLQNQSPVDVVLLGDSFGEGFYVLDNEDLGSRLRAHFPKTVNLAICHYAPLSELGVLEEFGRPLRPKNVVALFYEGGGLSSLQEELANPVLRKYIDPSFRQGLRGLQPVVDKHHVEICRQAQIRSQAQALKAVAEEARSKTPLVIVRSWRDIAKLVELRRLLRLTYRGLEFIPAYVPEFETVMLELRRRTESWGGTLYVVYIPFYTRLFPHDDGPTFYRQNVLNFLRANRFNLIDFYETIRQHPDPARFLPHRAPGHYNADGYQFLADVIAAEIKKRQ